MSPLADRMRPSKLSEVIGQEHIIAPGKLLYQAIKNNQLFSMVLWGPPGVGKTTLARVIASEIGTAFKEFSAVTTSTVELKKLFEEIKLTKNHPLTEGQFKPPIIFIDEIHRFNKAQQDAFLPFVENGTIILIGATTENPSFEIIGPLLSRTRVFVLKQLETEHLEVMVKTALKDKNRGLGHFKIKIEPPALEFLIEGSNGDGRKLLNTLEIASSSISENQSLTITKEMVEEALQKKALMYDKAGDEHYDTISAFIKSMRLQMLMRLYII